MNEKEKINNLITEFNSAAKEILGSDTSILIVINEKGNNDFTVSLEMESSFHDATLFMSNLLLKLYEGLLKEPLLMAVGFFLNQKLPNLDIKSEFFKEINRVRKERKNETI